MREDTLVGKALRSAPTTMMTAFKDVNAHRLYGVSASWGMSSAKFMAGMLPQMALIRPVGGRASRQAAVRYLPYRPQPC